MKKGINVSLIFVILFLLFLASTVYLEISDYSETLFHISLFVTGVALAANVALIISNYRRKKINLLEQKLDMWNTITYRVKKAGETAFNKMPLAIIVFNDNFVIEWANNFAKEIFSSELLEREISNLSTQLQSNIDSHLPDFDIQLYNRVFHCTHLLRDHVLYFYEITYETEVMKKYQQRTLCIGIMNLDNLDQTMTTLDAQTKASQMSSLIGILTDWAEKFNICIKGYSEERYLLIMDYQTLDKVIDDKVSVVNLVKDYCEKEELRITLSVGIACEDASSVDLLDIANEQLNIALSRGGNQAVISRDNKKLYFGAQSEAFEFRTPTEIRGQADLIFSEIRKYKTVFIMAHIQMDTDAFGACVAATKLCDSQGVKSYVVFDSDLVDRSVSEIYDSIQLIYQDKKELFVSPNEAISMMDEESLLLIVDVHTERMLLSSKVFRKSKNNAIIDHHRQNPDVIKDAKFTYIQPSASSSVELIMELLWFADKDSYEISSNEATWLIMGIIVDTNSFMLHTTDHTFNVLSMLMGYGGNIPKGQRYLRDDKEVFEKKIKNLERLEVYDNYGIIVCDNEIYPRSFIAKLADNIIQIEGIKAGFCIGKIDENTNSISARSLDEENVQIIMEKLGGGGHYTTSATQRKNETLEESKEKLLEVLNSLNEKGEKTMKIILVKDVKGKGKVNDILDIPMGHANYLLRAGQAIEASPENLRQLENNAQLEKEKEAKHLADMKDLKVKVEQMSVKVPVKVGANGKLFGSVSTKEIVDKFKQQNGIELDKKKIMFDESIDKLGTYKVPIQLHKEVTAVITLYVVEEGAK